MAPEPEFLPITMTIARYRAGKGNRGMTDQLKYLANQVTLGKMSRREFMGRAAAFGVTIAAAGTMFASAASAQEPKRGGHLKLGL